MIADVLNIDTVDCNSDWNMKKFLKPMKTLLDVACNAAPEESPWHDTGMDTITPVSVEKCDDGIADINPRSQRWLLVPLSLQ